jgi:hypothetical protein
VRPSNACTIKDVPALFAQDSALNVHDICGGKVKAILANESLTESPDRAVETVHVSVKCASGHTRIGSIHLDAKTCKHHSSEFMTMTTVVYP